LIYLFIYLFYLFIYLFIFCNDTIKESSAIINEHIKSKVFSTYINSEGK